MTQKELLYVEDAIGHEKTMIEILKSSKETIEDEDLGIFLEDEVKIHEKLEKDLIKLLEDLANE